LSHTTSVREEAEQGERRGKKGKKKKAVFECLREKRRTQETIVHFLLMGTMMGKGKGGGVLPREKKPARIHWNAEKARGGREGKRRGHTNPLKKKTSRTGIKKKGSKRVPSKKRKGERRRKF